MAGWALDVFISSLVSWGNNWPWPISEFATCKHNLNSTFKPVLNQSVHNMSGNRCESDCRSRGREFEPGPVLYFPGDWSWKNFYGHSPPFRWIIQEGLLSVTSESMCMKYWLTACSNCPGKSVVRWTDRPAMTIAVDLGRKATKTINQSSAYTVKIRKSSDFQGSSSGSQAKT